MENNFTFIGDQRKLVTYKGYAFIDEYGFCFMIVYGEGRRDVLSKYLLKKQTDETKN